MSFNQIYDDDDNTYAAAYKNLRVNSVVSKQIRFNTDGFQSNLNYFHNTDQTDMEFYAYNGVLGTLIINPYVINGIYPKIVVVGDQVTLSLPGLEDTLFAYSVSRCIVSFIPSRYRPPQEYAFTGVGTLNGADRNIYIYKIKTDGTIDIIDSNSLALTGVCGLRPIAFTYCIA